MESQIYIELSAFCNNMGENEHAIGETYIGKLLFAN